MELMPYQLAREQRELTLELPLAEFPRLQALVAADGGRVHVAVNFTRDAQGRCRMRGRLESEQRLHCANCREVAGCVLEVEVDACVLSSEEAAGELVMELDPLVLEGPRATPAELFEDDLLLALPERPCFGREDCPYRPELPPEQAETDAGVEREHPFAILAKLKDGQEP